MGSIAGTTVGVFSGYCSVGFPSFDADPEAAFRMSEDQQSLMALGQRSPIHFAFALQFRLLPSEAFDCDQSTYQRIVVSMVFKHLHSSPGFSKQMGCSLMGSIAGTTVGVFSGYCSVGFPSFDADPEAAFRMSEDQQSLMASIPPIGGILGALCSVLLLRRIGRKQLLHWFQLPILLSWLFIAFGKSYPSFLAAAVAQGLCVGVLMPAGQIYLGEIASPQIRGFIAGSTMLWQVFYNLVNYIMGSVLTWKGLALFNAGLHLLYFVGSAFAIESPVWHMSRGESEDANRCMRSLGREKEQTLDTLALPPSPPPPPPPPPPSDMQPDSHQKPPSGSTVDFSSWLLLMRKENFAPVLLLTVLAIMRQFTGAFAVISYTVAIFKSSGGGLSPYASTIVIGVVQLIFVVLFNVTTDKLGRKRLIVGSGAVMSVSLAVFAIHLYLTDAGILARGSWVPLATMVVCIAGFSFGISPSLFVLMSELMPKEVKNVASGIVAIANNVSNFVMLKTYYLMRNRMTNAGLFGFYGAVSFILTLVCAFCIPEIRRKKVEDSVPNAVVVVEDITLKQVEAKMNKMGDMDHVQQPEIFTVRKIEE
ncbi:unnamed protein product [Notodromas monacha]|uniref:Major facilitator superfamily (MFS) profile domain-containing protein n=1 Tax=Notodromas monacha TaxID=399045 RepID=A0A7R9BUF7_9CRUS|nr:unnamed protein product [Notodromas monacha]CAG0920874.1 unnamed protein product [Notodromas monacha]